MYSASFALHVCPHGFCIMNRVLGTRSWLVAHTKSGSKRGIGIDVLEDVATIWKLWNYKVVGIVLEAVI